MKTVLKIIASLVALVLGLLLYHFNKISADDELCQSYKKSRKNDAEFMLFVQTRIKGADDEIENRGNLNYKASWRKPEYIYQILNNPFAQKVYENPLDYLSDALYVTSSTDFGDTQKVYVAILMQQLPIKEYMCVMDAANEAYENNIIVDPNVFSKFIHPHPDIDSTSFTQWYNPDWREKFLKHAGEIYSEKHIRDVVNGGYAAEDPNDPKLFGLFP